MAEFGANSQRVQEVLDLARRGPLVEGGHSGALGDAVLERDPERAREIAWKADYSEGGFSWTDLRQRERARLRAGLYEDAALKAAGEELTGAMEKLTPWVKRHLKGQPDLLDDVLADLQGCALSRLVSSQPDPFHEALFRAYSAGGWPCGWEGEPPAGRPIVFLPTPG